MKKNKKTVEQEINEFFDFISEKETSDMLTLMFEVFLLYDVDQNDDWVKDSIENPDEADQARILKTVHLLSKMSDLYAGRFLLIKTQFKNLWQRMELQAKQN